MVSQSGHIGLFAGFKEFWGTFAKLGDQFKPAETNKLV